MTVPGMSVTSPTVLLIEDQEWTARSIESMLRLANFAVFKTYTGRQGLGGGPKGGTPTLSWLTFTFRTWAEGDVIRQLEGAPIHGALHPHGHHHQRACHPV
jgi:hypothetical protein